MSKSRETETPIERRAMAPWVKWGGILTVFACAATVIMAMPTIGAYAGHVVAIWHAPEQLQRVGILESNQVVQGEKIQSITENIRDIRQDVREGRQDIRDIKNILIRPPTHNSTNSIPR